MSFGHINFIQFSLLNIIFVCSCCLLAPVHDAPRKMTLEKKQLKFSEAQKTSKILLMKAIFSSLSISLDEWRTQNRRRKKDIKQFQILNLKCPFFRKNYIYVCDNEMEFLANISLLNGNGKKLIKSWFLLRIVCEWRFDILVFYCWV